MLILNSDDLGEDWLVNLSFVNHKSASSTDQMRFPSGIYGLNEQSSVVQTCFSDDFYYYFSKLGMKKHDFGKFRKPQLMAKNAKKKSKIVLSHILPMLRYTCICHDFYLRLEVPHTFYKSLGNVIT